MQHLHYQNDDIHTRKWNFDQKWNNAEYALARENYERNDDVDYSKRNLENKINSFEELQKNKNNLIGDNLRYQSQEADQIGRNFESARQKQKNYEELLQKRNDEFSTNYLQNSQAFADKILSYAKARCGDVERKLQNVDQNIRRKTSEEMKELKEASIEHIRSMITKEAENQKAHIQTLSNSVSDSLKNMRSSLKEYEKKCHQSDLKIQEEIQKLEKETFKLMDKESKEGDITYDCLLKLVEDSCAKIEYCTVPRK